MITPRSGHTATLLFNGKVLIAGGGAATEDTELPLGGGGDELYDPSTGTFELSGGISAGHTVTLLPDGRVLGTGLDLSATIYDPFTGAVTSTGNMVAHQYPWVRQAPLLPDGRVFIAGYPTAQLYDPTTGAFTATGPYAAPAPAILESATLLADGRVLLTGAVNICYQPLCRDPGASWVELFDPVSGTFSLAGDMKWWNTVYSATLLPSGKVLFAGTDNYNGIPSAAEIFDPADATFTAVNRPSPSPSYSAATLLPDGTVLIIGRRITGSLVATDNAQNIAELFTPGNATFFAASNIAAAGTSTLLPDGSVLIAGGSSAELFHPSVLIGAPKLFSTSADGNSQAAIWHAATGRPVSVDSPAVPGEILSMYTSGLLDDGVIPPQVAIGGRSARIGFFGHAPGYPEFDQVNFSVPAGVVPGTAVPLRLTYLGRSSNEVTIAVQ
ncbi:MAG TPA: hypothetical protein VN737_05100 [Bryobacteraceae bacterium]|nr:hypothetical protein [Bryobacteraceae bacterium]